MGKNERQAYLNAIRLRYRRARKKIKVTILDEFCSVCGYNRRKRAGYIYLNDRIWPGPDL